MDQSMDNDLKPNKNECLLISLKMTLNIRLLTSSRLSQIIILWDKSSPDFRSLLKEVHPWCWWSLQTVDVGVRLFREVNEELQRNCHRWSEWWQPRVGDVGCSPTLSLWPANNNTISLPHHPNECCYEYLNFITIRYQLWPVNWHVFISFCQSTHQRLQLLYCRVLYLHNLQQ